MLAPAAGKYYLESSLDGSASADSDAKLIRSLPPLALTLTTNTTASSEYQVLYQAFPHPRTGIHRQHRHPRRRRRAYRGTAGRYGPRSWITPLIAASLAHPKLVAVIPPPPQLGRVAVLPGR